MEIYRLLTSKCTLEPLPTLNSMQYVIRAVCLANCKETPYQTLGNCDGSDTNVILIIDPHNMFLQ